MSTLGTVTNIQTAPDKPTTTETSSDGSPIPAWGYGVIAGGTAAVASAGVIAYALINKKHRIESAKANAKRINDEYLSKVANGGDQYSPRPGEKIV